VTSTARCEFVSLLCLLLFLGVGCGGSGGSQGGSSTPPNPLPSLSGVSPNSASTGSAALTIAASGSGFVSASVIAWNGAPLATTYASSTSLTAQVPASDLISMGTASVTVENPAPGGGTSSAITFTIHPPSTNLTVLNLEGSDLTWDPSQKKLYVAVPSGASTNGSTITIVDPIAGTLAPGPTLTSPASGLAISDDSQYLYAVTTAGSAIQRFILPALTPDILWSLGTSGTPPYTNLAGDIKVEPGAAHTLAVLLGQYGSGSVAVFDDAVERSTLATVAGGMGNSLQWSPDGSVLYTAYTLSTVSGYYTTVSDDALYTMPVTASGVGAVTTYNSTFRSEGVHLHSDPTTGYVYGDWGEVVNGANGIPVGNYRWSRPNSTFFPGPLSVVNPTLARFYTLLEITEPDNSLAFQIQAFDQTQFQLLSTIVIPNAVGTPTNFISWGQAGLAFVTNGPSSGADGKLYILDGPFVNPSGTPDTTVGTAINPVPTLTAISPLTATVGSQALTLTITGRDFIGQPTVYWNGDALQTTLVNSTELSAQVPATDLASSTLAAITASNTNSSYPASNAMPFSVSPAPTAGNQIAVYSAGGSDLLWDVTTANIYVSMPGVEADSGDAIGIVDPVAGTVTSSGFLGSDPAKITLSSDSHYLYMALNGANAIQQLSLPGFSLNTGWNLGGVGSFDGPYYALELQAAPGAPQTTAVTLANFDVSPSAAEVVIYDGSTQRPNPLVVGPYPYSSLQWASSDSTLYAVDAQEPQDFLVLGVGSSGAVLTQPYNGIVNPYSAEIHYDAGTGFVYTDGGQAIDPSNGSVVGSYGASGIAVPDSTLDSVFILGQTSAQTGTPNYTIESFDQTKFTAVSSITVNNVVGTPTALIRWGTKGLAFTTLLGIPADFTGTGPGQLYVISGTFVAQSNVISKTSRTAPMLPVRRTWNLGTSSRQQLPSAIVKPNPLTQ
jgi:sugar lactone lactonase YvrE